MLKGKIVIHKDRCKGCMLCTSFCPVHLLTASEEFNNMGYHPVTIIQPEKCTACALCGKMCPDCAIEVYKEV